MTIYVLGILVLFVLITLFQAIKIVPQKQVKIIERLGKYHQTAEAGLNIIVPFLDAVRDRRHREKAERTEKHHEYEKRDQEARDDDVHGTPPLCFIVRQNRPTSIRSGADRTISGFHDRNPGVVNAPGLVSSSSLVRLRRAGCGGCP